MVGYLFGIDKTTDAIGIAIVGIVILVLAYAIGDGLKKYWYNKEHKE